MFNTIKDLFQINYLIKPGNLFPTKCFILSKNSVHQNAKHPYRENAYYKTDKLFQLMLILKLSFQIKCLPQKIHQHSKKMF